MMKKLLYVLAAALTISVASHAQTYRFDFGSAEAAEGFQAVTSAMTYDAERGYGFASSSDPGGGFRKKETDLSKDCVT